MFCRFPFRMRTRVPGIVMVHNLTNVEIQITKYKCPTSNEGNTNQKLAPKLDKSTK